MAVFVGNITKIIHFLDAIACIFIRLCMHP